MEAHFAARLAADPEEAVQRYVRRFGNVADTDLARRMFAEYDELPESRMAHAAAASRPARRLARLVYSFLLKGPGEEVLLTAGGAGSGKTEVIAQLAPGLRSEARVVFDSSLEDPAVAVQLVEEALRTGNHPGVLYVHRPIEAAMQLVIDRAQGMGGP